MGSIERRTQRGTVRYRAHYVDPGGRQRSKSFALKKHAETFLTGIESAKLTGQYVDPERGRLTLGDLADDWLSLKAGIRPSTRARYESAIETHIRPRWGTTPIARIDNESIQRWLVADLVGSQGPDSVRKVARVMSGILAKAVRDRRIANNPAHGLELPKPHPRHSRYLSLDEVERFAAAAFERGGVEARATVHVMAYCGPRPAELAGFRVRSVRVKQRRLEVVETVTNVNGRLHLGPPKDYERRSIPVPGTVMDNDLAALIKGRAADAHIFIGSRGGLWRASTVRRAWFDDAASDAGIKGLVPYDLRHTAASLAVSAGANVLAVSRMLGHADPSITLKTYADLFDKDLDDVGKRLDDLRIAYSLPSGAEADQLDTVQPNKIGP